MTIAVPNVQPLKRSGRLFLGVLVLGLLLRLVFLYATQNTGLMIEDERHYHQLALNVLHGHGFGWTPETRTSIRPPLYPFFEVFIWKITGTESLLYVRLAQVGLSLLTVYFLYRLGLLVFDQPVAQLAAAGVWLYPSLVAFNFLLLTEVLFTCLLTLVALGYVTLLRTRRAAAAWGTGGALGLAALTRSILWPFPIVLCPLTFFTLHGNWKSRAQLALYLLLGYILVVAPWAVRNTRLQGVFTVVDTMGGLNLLMGNYAYTPLNRAWDAVSLTGEKSWSADLPPTHPDGPRWTEGRKEKWAVRQAMTYMLAHPALTLQRAAIKCANFWGLERVIIAGWAEGFYHPPQWFAVLGAVAITLAYTLTMLLASLGFFLALPASRTAPFFLVSVIVFVCGVHTVVFGHERYHLPLMPFLLLYAAAAIRQRSWLRLREGMRTATAPVLTCILLLGVWGRELLFVETGRVRELLHIVFG
jgi:4-amino-4-deoxy-L-arabinose transferase-like glycosyltransferase